MATNIPPAIRTAPIPIQIAIFFRANVVIGSLRGHSKKPCGFRSSSFDFTSLSFCMQAMV
ncbi:hypothetical protein V3851_01685 [Paenibacillus sp. M1]|uniref:Uncharacterized protein n=1 Tax=Paenibacillus haidiansis TaxID=1574488 RepID=A0ABU7VL95_9BACL